MKGLLLSLIILLICSIALVGCGEPEETTAPTTAPTTTPTTKPTTAPTTEAGGPQYGGTFRVIDARSPTNLGWWASPGMFGGGTGTHEPIVVITNEGEVKPNLATGWTVSPDLKSVTLSLRQGVKFHDGSDFNGEVAKWNLEQHIIGKTSSSKDWESVDLIDEYTIRINLKKYSNTIFADLGSYTGFMVSKEAYEANGKDWMKMHPVGTGPFKFVSYEKDVATKLVKFDDYWQEGKPYVDALELIYIANAMTRVASFEAGEADAFGGDIGITEYELQQKGYPVARMYAGVVMLVPDSNNPQSPFANLKVRQAIDYAINRDAIVEARGFGFWESTYLFDQPGSASYIDNLQARTYNPEKARQLLDEAGFGEGLEITLFVDGGSTDHDGMVAVQGFLEAVGIKTSLNFMDLATFNSYRNNGWENGCLAGPQGFFANPNIRISTYFSKDAPYFASVKRSDELESLYIASTTSAEYDPELFKKCLQYIFDNALGIPLFCVARGHVFQPYVHDHGYYTKGSFTQWTPENVWLSK